MFSKIKWLFFCLVIFGVGIGESQVEASIVDWRVIETPHYRVYTHKKWVNRANITAQHLESNHHKVEAFVSRNITEKTNIVYQDEGLLMGGSASVSPKHVKLKHTPSNSYSFYQLHSFDRLVSLHEMVHINQMSTASKGPGFLAKWVGPTMYPHLTVPTWYTEGLAVQAESSTYPNEGRLHSGYYKSVIQSQPSRSLAQITTPIDDYPGGRAPYIFGGTFMGYLDQTYGTKKRQQVIALHGSKLSAYLGVLVPSLGLDSSIKSVYGKSTTQLYQDWQKTIKIKNDTNTLLSKGAWSIVDITSHQDSIVAAQTELWTSEPGPYKLKNKLVFYQPESNKIEKETLFHHDIVPPIKSNHHSLFMFVTTYKTGFDNISESSFGARHQLLKYNPSTQQKKVILEGAYTSFCLSTDETLYLAEQTDDGYKTTIKKYQQGHIKRVKTIPLLVSEMELINDSLWVIAKSSHSAWGLYKIGLNTDLIESIISGEASVFGLKKGEGVVLFSKNTQTGIHTYRYNLTKKSLSQLTDVTFSKQAIIVNESLYYIGMTPKGEGLFNQELEPKERPLGIPNKVPLDQLGQQTPPFNNAANIPLMAYSLESLMPIKIEFPSIIAKDPIGAWSYSIGLSHLESLRLFMSNRHFAPYVLNFEWKQRSFFAYLARPFYRDSVGVLQAIDGALLSNFNSELIGQVRTSFKHQAKALYTSHKWNVINGGSFHQVKMSKEMPKTKVSAKISGFSKMTTKWEVPGVFNKWILNGSGSHANVQVTHDVWQPRVSFYNPIVASVDRVFLRSRIDHHSFDKETSLSVEFAANTVVSTARISVIPYIGTTAKANAITPYIGFSSSFSF